MGAPDYESMAITALILWTIIAFGIGVVVGINMILKNDKLPTKGDVDRLREALEDLENVAKRR